MCESTRFGSSAAQGPGPADYNSHGHLTMVEEITKKLKRIRQKKKESKSQDRCSYFRPKANNPGPGEYLAPSAFGHYLSAKGSIGPIETQGSCERLKTQSLIQEYQSVVRSAKQGIREF